MPMISKGEANRRCRRAEDTALPSGEVPLSSACPGMTAHLADVFAEGNLPQDSKTQKRWWMLNNDHNAKNKNLQLSENLSTSSDMWSRMAGSDF